jgi:hypothetical protein
MKQLLGRILLLLAIVTGRAQAQAPTWQAALALTTYNISSCYVTAEATNTAGDVFIVGNFSGALNLSGITVASIGGTDGFVAKWSGAANQFVWAERIAGVGSDMATGVAVNGTSVYVVGSFNSSRLYVGGSTTFLANAGGFDAYVVKLTDAGASDSYTWGQRLGGISFDEASAVAVNGTSVYLTGYIGNNGTVTFGALPQPVNAATMNSEDAYLAKLTDTGTSSTFTWAQLSGGTDSDRGVGVAVSGTTIYLAGLFRSASWQASNTTPLLNAGGPNRTADVFVTKYSDAGATASLTWAQRTGGTADEQPLSLAVSGTNVYVSGTFTGTAQFASTSLVAQQKDGFAVKFTDEGSKGTALWAQRMSSTGDDTAQSLAVGNLGEVYVAGICSPQAATFGNVSTAAGGSSYVARLADSGASGTVIWALRGGGSGYDGARALALTPAGRLYVGGSYTYTGTFGTLVLPDPGTYQLNTGYLAYVQGTPLATLPTQLARQALTIFPNPAYDHPRLQVPAVSGPAVITVHDVLGRLVSTHHVLAKDYQSDMPLALPADLLPGVYRVTLSASGQQWTTRLVLERQ